MDFRDIYYEFKPYLILIIVLLLARFVIIQVYKRRKNIKGHDNFVLGMNNLTTILAAVICFFTILRIFGITVSEFFTSITIIAAALAIVFKDYILNALNGMVFLFGDTLQIGDWVRIGDHKGKVMNITLMSVTMQNESEDLVIIPNNVVSMAEIINFSKNTRHYSSVDFEIKSNLLLNVPEFEKKLMGIMRKEEHLLKEEGSSLKIVEWQEDVVHYRYKFVLRRFDAKDESRIKQMIWRKLLETLKEYK